MTRVQQSAESSVLKPRRTIHARQRVKRMRRSVGTAASGLAARRASYWERMEFHAARTWLMAPVPLVRRTWRSGCWRIWGPENSGKLPGSGWEGTRGMEVRERDRPSRMVAMRAGPGWKPWGMVATWRLLSGSEGNGMEPAETENGRWWTTLRMESGEVGMERRASRWRLMVMECWEGELEAEASKAAWARRASRALFSGGSGRGEQGRQKTSPGGRVRRRRPSWEDLGDGDWPEKRHRAPGAGVKAAAGHEALCG